MFRIQFIENMVLSLLEYLVSILGNYGLAILATTIIVKILLYPLSVKQEKSMFKMKLIQPQIDEINKKYKGDKATISQKTAEIYKENKINPLGGCLPVLVQLPIFMALYFTFTSNAIPDTATFLWFKLSSPDALFTIHNFNINLLPILSGVLMFVQQKMQAPSKSGDSNVENSMQNAMMALPLLMTFMFYSFPSGVNLYYVANTVISIAQQKYIQHKVAKEFNK
ncbi:YidC/Oxa1 family membrane protein insertase [Oceanivirga miroungae]|uniref:Membrane protein insertase YidC n=1 Tax=Oceanivirga miroungae TaxID=1130046 RepID=A0A6I8MD54_9FUSO|nr:membrane protein insertase YidC [Oceanivirga miroungae]VWL85083.1 Membrane protein insertase YidC [Oceanivirga miroungae]